MELREFQKKVVRRLTGGGAVYHDLGNINYTFIENSKKSFNDFRGFCEPITKALNELGVQAEFSGRNDMTIDGKKFSGTAQCKHKNRVMHHGTLLFSSKKADISVPSSNSPACCALSFLTKKSNSDILKCICYC